MNDGLGMIRELTLAQDKNIFLRKKKRTIRTTHLSYYTNLSRHMNDYNK